MTDITEFSIPAGKVYLSPLVDCYDGLITSWSISPSPNAQLVNSMLETALDSFSNDNSVVIHSDRRSHYRWPQWIEMMDKNNLIRSMSKKGCSPDNSACEGFFGRLKNEMFYNKDWTNISIDKFIEEVDIYIKWYNKKRIKKSLGWLSPIDYRREKGVL